MANSVTWTSRHCVVCGSPLVGLFDFTGRIAWVCYVCTAGGPKEER